MIKFLLVHFLLAVVCFQSVAQVPKEKNIKKLKSNDPFEGSITFVKQTFSDTSYYIYYIKGDCIRFDELDNCEKPSNCILFNLKNSTIKAISPARKLYIDIQAKPYTETNDSNFEIIKSQNNKKIQGYDCYQWRVRNKAQNTEVSYWVVDDNFMFWGKFLRLWNRPEKHSLYFLQIKETAGFMPMLSDERTTLRESKMELYVTKIERKKLPQSMFEIPKDYSSYDR